MSGTLFALVSLILAGLNDLLFKYLASGSGGRERHMAIIGTVWTVVFSAAAIASDAAPDLRSLLWGLLAGFLSAFANHLLLRSLRGLDASTGATIYRINMVPAAVIALLFLGEEMTARKALGLAAGCLAILSFKEAARRGRGRAALEPALVLALAASLLRALMGIVYKLAAGSQREWFLAVQGTLWIAVGLFAPPRRKTLQPLRGRDLLLGLMSGMFVCGIVLSFARATELGEASVVIPISQLSFVITTLLAVPLMRERLTTRKIVGICLAFTAVFLLSSA